MKEPEAKRIIWELQDSVEVKECSLLEALSAAFDAGRQSAADQSAATETGPKMGRCGVWACEDCADEDETAARGAPDELAELVANTCSPEEQRARIENAKRELAATAAPQGAPLSDMCSRCDTWPCSGQRGRR